MKFRKRIQDIKEELEQWDVEYHIQTKGFSKHPKIIITLGEQQRTIAFAGSPSDNRGDSNFLSNMRKLLISMGAKKYDL